MMWEKTRDKEIVDRALGRKCRIEGVLRDLRRDLLVTDFRFDEVFPRAMRDLSETHWTPVDVALRAAGLLALGPKTRILDVGAGCGKFCLLGALTTQSIFVGIEQRSVLVEIAKATRDSLRCRRVAFAHGNMVHLDWSCFDSFYLYNPFYEHQIDTIRIDESIAFGEDVFDDYVRTVETKLSDLKVGTRVVTYHGFGGSFPPGYRLILKEQAATGFLELWEKTLATRPRSTMIVAGRDEKA
jgi:SAM-dependent methyltransferase